MKAAWYERNGPAIELMVVGEQPTPQAGAGDVRVKLHTSGVNPSDVKSRMVRPLMPKLLALATHCFTKTGTPWMK